MDSNRKIKVLFVCHDCTLYGAQISLLTLLRNIDRDLFEPHVIVPSPGSFVEALEECAVPYQQVKMQHWLPGASERSLKLYVRRLFTMPARVAALVTVI